MERGNATTDPIVRAIALAEAGTTAELRVHLTKRLVERNPRGRAVKLFDRYGMARTRYRNAALLYVNLRRRKFALVADQSLEQAAGAAFWRKFTAQLSEDFHATHPERAIALALEELGKLLRLHFPEETGHESR